MSLIKRLCDGLGAEESAVWHGLRVALASWLSFLIALALHIHNPYWAAMPAWVVAQATRGFMLERGFFRLLGTLVGAGVGLLILRFSHLPYFQLVTLAAWICVCAMVTKVLRGVHSYGSLLSGITAAVVVLPSVLEPGQSMEIAVARIECTLIGVVVVTLLVSWFTPDSGRGRFYLRVRKLAGESLACAAASLRGQETAALEQRLLSQIAEVESSASLVSAGSFDGYRRLNHVHALVYASVELMAAARSIGHGAGAEKLAASLEELGAQLALESFSGKPNPAWSPAIDQAFMFSTRLSRALEQLMAAETALFIDPRSADARSFSRKAVYLSPHYDMGEALRAGLVCGAGTLFSAGVSLAVGWRAGLLAALGVSIFGLILSTVPFPQRISPRMTAGVCVGVLLATFYRLFLQAGLQTEFSIALSLLPLLLVGGVLRAIPVTSIAALDFIMCFLLASQIGLGPAPMREVLNGSGALIAGSVFVTLMVLLRPANHARRARNQCRRVLGDLEQLAAKSCLDVGDWKPFASRQILSFMVHLGRMQESPKEAPAGSLSVINLGQSITELAVFVRDRDMGEPACERARRALKQLEHFRQQPDAVSTALLRLAEEPCAEPGGWPEERLSRCLRQAAGALQDSLPFIRFAA